jgi:hypothetical protein
MSISPQYILRSFREPPANPMMAIKKASKKRRAKRSKAIKYVQPVPANLTSKLIISFH